MDRNQIGNLGIRSSNLAYGTGFARGKTGTALPKRKSCANTAIKSSSSGECRMKWCIFSFCNLAAIACSGHAMAEENVCVELARTIGLNYQNYLDVDQQQAVAKADLCSDNYSSASSTKQAQLQASYKVFSGSASASDAEVQVAQSHYCEGHFGAYWRNQIKTGEARTVSEEGAAVITNCIELTNKGLFPSLTIANDGQEVALSVQYKPAVVGDIKIKQFGPSDVTKASCTITKEGSTLHMAKITDAAQTLRPADSVLLTCLRELKDKKIDGVTYRCTDETIFSIATSGTTKSIKIPKICNQTIEESRADKLEKQIKQINDQLAKLKADNAGELKNKLNNHIDLFEIPGTYQGIGNWFAACPEGSYVISGFCQVDGPPESHGANVNIQNFGRVEKEKGNGWLCVWRDLVQNATVKALCARPK